MFEYSFPSLIYMFVLDTDRSEPPVPIQEEKEEEALKEDGKLVRAR